LLACNIQIYSIYGTVPEEKEYLVASFKLRANDEDLLQLKL